MTEPKTSFEQIYQAFGGFSPGGIDKNNILYIEESKIKHIEGYQDIINKLNNDVLIGKIEKIVLF